MSDIRRFFKPTSAAEGTTVGDKVSAQQGPSDDVCKDMGSTESTDSSEQDHLMETDTVTPSTESQVDASSPGEIPQMNYSYDIGTILTGGEESKLLDTDRSCAVISKINDETKYRILSNHFQPDHRFQFPTSKQHGCNRRCKIDFLDQNFRYSKFADGIYCLPCALLTPLSKRKSLQHFVNKCCRTWHNIKEKQKLHCETQYHRQAVVDVQHFKARFEKPQSTLPHFIDTERQVRSATYHAILLRIAQVIHTCGKQGFAIRGHRENIIPSNPNENPGNFLALIREVAKDDPVLLSHITKPVARNATYLRPQSQNEMIEVIGHGIIQSDILKEIKEAGFHTLMVDEVTSSNDQLMSLCIRFVDQDKNIREEFLDFINLHRITGEAISTAILEFYDKVGLDITLLRGQCYDGCSSMSSHKRGVAGLILKYAPSAAYTHCNAHILNLSIASSCRENNIQHVIATMKDVAIFINYSPKRERLLEMVANKRVEHLGTRKVIIGLCKTRWSERDKAYEHFYLALPFLVECFEIINGTHPELEDFHKDFTSGWDADSKREATARLKAVTDFGFIVSLVSLYHLLHPLHGLTQMLQGRTLDAVRAYQQINETVSSLKAVRADIDNQFHTIYTQATRIADKVSVTPDMPRIARRQTHRLNQPADNPEEYYRRTVAICLLDAIITEMETRFDNMSQRAAKLLCLVPSVYMSPHRDFDKSSAIQEAAEMYKSDLPNPDLIEIELRCWQHKWENVAEQDRPDSLAKAIKICDENFPNLAVLLQIACTHGVTSAECERSFSTMRRLRHYLRATMGSTRLSALALMNIHYGHKVDYERAVALFMRLHPRRIQQPSLLFN